MLSVWSRSGLRSLKSVVIAVLGVTLAGRVATADGLGAPIDLSGFGEISQESVIPDNIPLQEVAQQFGTAPRRFYLSGMIGPSFATVTSPEEVNLVSSDTLFNAGGAVGVAFERDNGRLRLELEGMGRGTYDAAITGSADPSDFTLVTNNWSVIQNVWRDLMITERFGVYGGGGIGAGGYILGERLEGEVEYASPAASFAWQAGGGILWELGDRLTFDVGYRYFQIDTIEQAVFVVPNQFAASELMFTLRLYEPFRNWRR